MATNDKEIALLPAGVEPISAQREINRLSRITKRFQNTEFFKKTDGQTAQSSFFDDLTIVNNVYGNRRPL